MGAKGVASGRFNWDNEGKVLGKRGGPPQKQRIESRKGEGTEEGGGEEPTPGTHSRKPTAGEEPTPFENTFCLFVKGRLQATTEGPTIEYCSFWRTET